MRRIFTSTFIWHELFEAGILLKLINAVWGTAAGVLVLWGPHLWWARKAGVWAREEFLGGRGGFLFEFVMREVGPMSLSTRYFVGIYLLVHGLLNFFVVYNLFRNRLWAYPLAMGVVFLFVLYQFYRLAHTHSPILLVVTLFDIAFIILTWHEYRSQLAKQQP